jgi:8-oxo-dGTP pyrophosphatase MutT (NUDIX family)
VVRAAGGVVVRRDSDRWSVVLVHRPRYDDWTFPKGKQMPGESDEETALREVQEETGLRCELDEPIGEITYRDRFGRPKVVRYWRMRPIEGRFEPTNEVDELRWVSPDEALRMLTYERDRVVLRQARGRFDTSRG